MCYVRAWELVASLWSLIQQCFTILWQLLLTLLIPRCSTFVIKRRAWRHDSSFIALNVFTIIGLPTPCVVSSTWFCSFACFYQLPAKSVDITKNSSSRPSSTAVRCLNQCFSNILFSWPPLSLMNLCLPHPPTLCRRSSYIIIIIIIIYLTANGLSPGGSGYNACT
jgi:hypothetical protein